MSDDLVKRLRHRVPEPGRPYKSDATVPVNPQGDEAADRIEALEAKLAEEIQVSTLRGNHIEFDLIPDLHHAEARITALTAERDALAKENEQLRSDIKRFELEHQTDHGCIETLMGERDALAEKLEKAVEALKHIEHYDIHAPTHARAALAQITGGKTDE